MASNPLLQEFPPVSTESWEEVIRKDLKGADYAKKLVWQTEDGLAVKPYYRAEDLAGLDYLNAAPGCFPYVRGTRATADWRIREEIDEVDAEKANQAACSAIVAGAEEIAFCNVEIKSATDLRILLANLSEIPVHFQNANESLLAVSSLKRSRCRRFRRAWIHLRIRSLPPKLSLIAPPRVVPFTIRGETFDEAGATAVQEVGFTLAAGIDFLAADAIGSGGHRPRRGLHHVLLCDWVQLLPSDCKAARVPHGMGACGRVFRRRRQESAKARIHARTARWNETIYDPHVNILRATTEAMSAAIGGADSISVAPFDECYRKPDEASRRMARNAQILLKQEALLCRVSDPGGGSYCIEVITDFIAPKAWKSMQELEAAGGYQKAQADGHITRALKQSLAAKEKAVVQRRRIFTGTSQHANLTEKALERIDPSRPRDVRRGAEVYEQLRLRTERAAGQSGKTPRVLSGRNRRRQDAVGSIQLRCQFLRLRRL